MNEAKAQVVAIAEPAPPPAVSESAAILQVIERAARDPAVDIEKMERLLALQERIIARNAVASFNFALSAMQVELPVITQRGEIVHNGRSISKYALFEDIVTAIRPILSRHGFSLTYQIGQEGDKMRVTGLLRHQDGHVEQTTITLPVDMSGAKNAVQGVGSSISYAKRYVTCALLNLATGGEDDDGQGAGGGLISDDQKAELVALLKETESDVARFLKFMGVEAVDQIAAKDFDKAKRALEAKRGKK